MIVSPTKLAGNLLGKPLAIHPGYFPAAMGIEARDFDDGASFDRGYELIEGVAVIPVLGTLVQELGTIYSWGDVTGYDGIRANYLLALADPKARAIALSIKSGGGDCAALFDLADLIYKSRSIKPSLAICGEVAYSAAYALASACEQITVPRTGGTGSVGVVAAHVDVSKALDNAGIAVTFFHYGDRKVDGHSEIPLTDEAFNRFQADVDELGELFVATVARNRNMSIEAVRGTQASTFLGAAGVEIGFADAVMAPDEAFRSLLAELG
ncbi:MULTISPECIES: S49 family peptidase [unclassified Paraburkholderia]|uniref:S49 family peptidase n=1 Tax=unclassified Paraburkholderia TaxID=2615204 RepID=UPI0016216F33|nr:MULTISPECIES: S49 family peptidase [unclassified Paraburkholderia]MBB5444643.1 ClpP class serine protease [Paraburkholderia sp. WSM4177]MBB5485468.1 ClpP class serine protease [Paraburkholderia sp. WSM4180]